MAKKSNNDLAELQKLFKIELEKKQTKKSKPKKSNVKRKANPKAPTKKRKTSRRNISKTSGGGKKKPKLVSKSTKVSKKGNKPQRKRAKASKVQNEVRRVRSKKSGASLETTRKTSIDNAGNKSYFLFLNLKPFRSFKAKIDAIRNWSGNGLKYFMDLKYPMFPRAFMIILTTMKKGKGNEPYERANRMSANDINVDLVNIKNLILEYMVAFQDNYLEYIGDEEITDSDWVYNPQNIIGVSIRFFYALPEKPKFDPLNNPTFDI